MIDWEKLLGVWLAFPCDRALDPASARDRAARYMEAAGLTPSEEWFQAADRSVAAVLAACGIEVDNHPPLAGQEVALRHPLSGREHRLRLPECTPDLVAETIRSIVSDLPDPRTRAIALWRLLPDRLAAHNPAYDLLPAHADLPSAPVWVVLDAAAAFAGTDARLLHAADIGGVQRFVSTSRTTRDLWSASLLCSLLMSWLIEAHLLERGPQSIVFPAVRGTPLLDLALHRLLGEQKVPLPDRRRLVVSSFPNAALLLGNNPAYWRLTDDREMPREPLCPAVRALSRRLEELGRAVRELFGDHVQQHLGTELAEGWDRSFDAAVPLSLPVLVLTRDIGTKNNRGAEQERDDRSPEPDAPEGEDGDEVALCWGGSEFVPSPQLRTAIHGLIAALGEDGFDVRNWQDAVHVITRKLHGVKRTTRPLRQPISGMAAPKCTLCGEREQVGPVDFDRSREFWMQLSQAPSIRGIRFSRRDRLCGEDLVKRLLPAVQELEPFRTIGRHTFPDLATIAAADWLAQTRGTPWELDPEQIRREAGHWSGEWLHWPEPNFDPDEPPCPREVFDRIERARQEHGAPPTYAAIIASDGDNMGLWLDGAAWPSVAELTTERIRERLDAQASGASGNAPLIGPLQQLLFSTALSNYSIRVIPDLVEDSGGYLVYAGGDDILAFAPAARASAIAARAYEAFRGTIDDGSPEGFVRSAADGRTYFVPGPRATCSCGIALVHHKEDLRYGLSEAKGAQKWAKDCGRDLLAIAVLRRSGEHTRALCPWPFTQEFQRWVSAFSSGVSDRWVHRVARVLDAVVAAGPDCVARTLVRELKRSEDRTIAAFGGEGIAETFETYRKHLANKQVSPEEAARSFLQLLLAASFLTRRSTEAA